MTRVLIAAIGAASLAFTGTATAEVVKSSPDHFTLKLEAQTELSPDEVWTRLLDPSEWWLSDHTYSGSSENLSLDAQAGGLWREDWKDGSVWHGQVLQVKAGEMISLNAPFGPLQGLAVNSVWTITLAPEDHGGTKITFDHVTNGTLASGLDELAPAVDFVKGEALKSLTRPRDEGE